ncbi:MAG TPA: oligosaccharide flippase family protein [Solirubrobacterales bacterium]|nr:oligosaccharide flippase family protein [Solirubrobacterales bacterium]
MSDPGRDPDDVAPAGLGRTVIRGVGIAGSGYVLAQAITLGFYIALARLAAPEDFGEFAAGSVLIGFALLVSETGIMAALIQRRSRLEEAAATAVLTTLASGTFFALVALALSPLVGAYFESDKIGEIAAVMSGIIFLRTLTAVPDALLQRRFSFVRRIVIEPTTVLAFGIAAVIATSHGLGAWGLVIGQYAAHTLEVFLCWGLAKWRPQLRLASFGMWRELVGYGRHVLAASAILRVGEQADSLWLGRFLGTAALGQFRYAMRVASTPYWALVAGASFVLFPAFSRIATEPGRFEEAFMRSLRWMALAGFFAAAIVLGLGEPLTIFLFGDVWQPAGIAVMALCMYTAAGVLSSIASEALKAHGRPDLLTRMHTLTTVLSAALMGVGVTIGLSAVAAGISIGWSVSAVYAIHLLSTTIGFSLRRMWGEIWPAAIAALVSAAVLVPLEQIVLDAASRDGIEAAALIVAEGLAGAVVFLAALWVVKRGTARELAAGARSLHSRVRGS